MQIRPYNAIQFHNDTATLTEDSGPILNAIADFLNQHPEIRHIFITGYAGNAGDTAMSVRLASLRASAVRQYLAGRGVAIARISSAGYINEPGTSRRLIHIEVTEIRQ